MAGSLTRHTSDERWRPASRRRTEFRKFTSVRGNRKEKDIRADLPGLRLRRRARRNGIRRDQGLANRTTVGFLRRCGRLLRRSAAGCFRGLVMANGFGGEILDLDRHSAARTKRSLEHDDVMAREQHGMHEHCRHHDQADPNPSLHARRNANRPGAAFRRVRKSATYFVMRLRLGCISELNLHHFGQMGHHPAQAATSAASAHPVTRKGWRRWRATPSLASSALICASAPSSSSAG